MIITTATLDGLTLGGSSAGRSTGLHMSDIYNSYFQEREPQRYRKDKPMDLLRVEAGLIFESLLEEGLQAKFGLMLGGERPGEFLTDEGIAYSPDLIIFPEGRTVLGEIKLTWMSAFYCPISPEQSIRTGIRSNWDGRSSIEFPDKFAKYFVQMKAYCYHLHTQHARLIAYFVNGDYRPPSPCLLAWDMQFTDVELIENWKMLRNHAKHKGLLP